MSTRVGVGRSTNRKSRVAGAEAAREALGALAGEKPSVVIVFGTTGHDQDDLLGGVRDVTGATPLVGCSGEGVISRHGSEETSHVVGVAVIAEGAIRFETFFVPGFVDDSAACARSLLAAIEERGTPGSLLVLFPDGIGGDCTKLVDVLEAGLPAGTQIAGGTSGDLFAFSKTFQYCGERASSGGLSALLIGGAVRPEVVVSHGCDLIGRELTVTRAANGFVEEIDGQPAWSFFKAYLTDDVDSLEAMHLSHLLLAERIGGSEEGVDDFAVRVPVKLDKERGALFFPAGIREGARVQLARRNVDKVCKRAVDAARRVVSSNGASRPLMVLDFECAGRGGLLFGAETTTKLITPVRSVFGERVPWLGVHTYGEIARVAGKTWFHNYTSIICALYED